MNVRPARLGRMAVSGLMAVMLLAGCQQETQPSATGETEEEAATVQAVEPSLCDGGTVVSAQAADTSGEVTVAEMQAFLLTTPAVRPQGFRSQAVVVDGGLGSFRLSAPESFAGLWRRETPAGEFLALAEERDPAWAGFWGPIMRDSTLLARAISLDTARTDEMFALIVTLTETIEESGDGLALFFDDMYQGQGFAIGEACGVRANGSEGAYVEHTIPRGVVGGAVDRTQLQFLIPDPPNGLLWGVTCDVPRPLASEVKDLCREIASTFQPLPAVVPG